MQLSLLLIPFTIGLSIVVQGGVNRLMTPVFGLGGVILLNLVIQGVIAGIVFILGRGPIGIHYPEFRPQDAVNVATSVKFSWILAGLLGSWIVFGIPLSIPRIGAVAVFTTMIAAQLGGSIVWDLWVENRGIGWGRAIGVGLTFAGALLSVYN